MASPPLMCRLMCPLLSGYPSVRRRTTSGRCSLAGEDFAGQHIVDEGSLIGFGGGDHDGEGRVGKAPQPAVPGEGIRPRSGDDNAQKMERPADAIGADDLILTVGEDGAINARRERVEEVLLLARMLSGKAG